MKAIKCWLRGHDMFTSQVVAPPRPLAGGPLPPHVYVRDGYIISALPCARCGAPNPDAYGWRHGAYHYRIQP